MLKLVRVSNLASTTFWWEIRLGDEPIAHSTPTGDPLVRDMELGLVHALMPHVAISNLDL